MLKKSATTLGILCIFIFLLRTTVFASTQVIPVAFRSVNSCTSDNVASSKFGIDNGCTHVALGIPDFSAIPKGSKITYASMKYLDGTNLTPPFPISNWPVAIYRSTNTNLSDSTIYSDADSPGNLAELATDTIYNGNFSIFIPEFQNLFNSNKGFIVKKTTNTDNEYLSSFHTFALTVDYTTSVPSPPIFSDSFSGGFDSTLWSVNTNEDTAIPVSSPFGIGDTNNNQDIWYRIQSKYTPLPTDTIVRLDIKINSDPSSMYISCKEITNNSLLSNNIKWVFLRNNGTFSFDSFLNGGGSSSGSIFTYDISPGIHHIELHCFSSMMEFIEDGVSKGSWDNNLNYTPNAVSMHYKNGDSEFANYKLCYSNGCITDNPTPTPIDTATPTPTDTPTPTLTVTPTPIPTRKVVIVPGMGGSWNTGAILSCQPNGNYGNWSMNPLYAPSIYNPLITQMQQEGMDPIFYSYDWRKQVPVSGAELDNFISALPGTERISLVGHSMGGLVGRAYLELTKQNNKVDRFLSVSSPHEGSAFAYPAWSAGEIVVDNVLIRLAMSSIIKGCAHFLRLSNPETVRYLIPSTQNILPRFDYLTWYPTGLPIPHTNMNAQNNWILDKQFTNPYYGTIVQTISGFNRQTLSGFLVKAPSHGDVKKGNWTDGNPMKSEYSNVGDNTVLTSSAQIASVTDTPLDQDHGGVMSSIPGINAITDFLGYPANLPMVINQNPPSSALIVIGYPGDIQLTDDQGNEKRSTDSMVGFLQPKSGKYTFTLTPRSDSTRFIVAQLLENNKTLWKEYEISGKSRKTGVIHLDIINPSEDIAEITSQ